MLVIAWLADPAGKQYGLIHAAHKRGATNIALAVGLDPRDFAAVAAHTDRVGHEFIAVSDDCLMSD